MINKIKNYSIIILITLIGSILVLKTVIELYKYLFVV